MTDKELAEYWKEEYFNLIFKRGSYVNHIKTLNESLRLQLHNRSEEIKKYGAWIQKTGDTTYYNKDTFDGSISNGRYSRKA